MDLLHFQVPVFATMSQLEVQLKDCRPAVLVILVAFQRLKVGPVRVKLFHQTFQIGF
jgi:hypothetical protein